MAKRLQSFADEEHLGAVNELAWWKFMEQAQVRAYPIPTLKKKSTPDFGVCFPSEFFIEVSTLNISRCDKAKFEANESVALDHSETLRRVLGKLTEEKKNQFLYADNLSKPCLLVLFDYTAWSGLGTKFDCFLADFLFDKLQGFKEFPPELSALAYVERKVIKGRTVLSRHRSAIYYNSYAKTTGFGCDRFRRPAKGALSDTRPRLTASRLVSLHWRSRPPVWYNPAYADRLQRP